MFDRYFEAAGRALSPAAGLELARAERAPGRAAAIVEGEDLRPGEVVLVVSNPGVNAVPIEVAIGCRDRGLRVVALTNLAQAEAAAADNAELLSPYLDRAQAADSTVERS